MAKAKRVGAWYEYSCGVIIRVIAENQGGDPDELRKKVSEAYPFGQRRYYPYKAWLKAVTKLLGPSEKKLKAHHQRVTDLESIKGQETLFNEVPKL